MTGPVRNDTAFRAETPEGIEYTLYPAGLCARFCAYSIDTLLQWILLAGFYIVYYVSFRAAAGIWLVFLVRFALDWFYHIVCELAFRGQSPGKRLLGLRVVLQDGSPVSAGASFIRNLLRFADSFIGLYLIAFASIAASRGFRRPGDWAAGTLVIYTWQSQATRHAGQMDWLSGITPAFPRRPLSFEEKQGILMFARRYPLLGPARAGEIAAPLALSLSKDPSIVKRGEGGASGLSHAAGPSQADGPSGYLLGIARSFGGEP